jgi:hypothetical protein
MIQAVKRRLVDTGLKPSRSRKGFCRVGGRNLSTGLPCCDGIGEEIPMRAEPQAGAPVSQAEPLLTSIIKYWVVRVRGGYGCDGIETWGLVCDLVPDLCDDVGRDSARKLCYEINHAADASLSEWYTGRFYEYNKTLFDGCLEKYEVLVVYNIFPWIGESPDPLVGGRIDHAGRRIIVALRPDSSHLAMDAVLLHLMAHAKTNTSTDDADSWREEMRRLYEAGADVPASDLDD